MKKLLLLLLLVPYIALSNTTIYLVRHAEKEQNKKTKDPDLTAIGQFRANNIANQLSAVGITHIYSTNYKRTKQTAQPLASLLDITVKQYDPSQLEQFASQLKSIKGNALVVGHSNTTPQLTELLSGYKVDAMTESDFTPLYQVILLGDKPILNHFKTIPAANLKPKQ